MRSKVALPENGGGGAIVAELSLPSKLNAVSLVAGAIT